MKLSSVSSIIRTFLVLGYVLYPQLVSAEMTGTLSNMTPSAEPFSMTESLIRMIGGLFLCMGVFGGGIHLYKKFIAKTSGGLRRRMTVIERLPVGQKSSLVLVALDGREFLIATGPDATTVLNPAHSNERCFEESFEKLYAQQGECNAQ